MSVNQDGNQGHGGKRPGSGRPPGTKNKATPEQRQHISNLAKQYAEQALLVLEEIMLDTQAPHAARAAAANSLLDRGWGRPIQAHEVGGPDGGPMVVEIVRFGGEEGAADGK